ncbi:PREDICTED: uncharacterized protein LOC108793576 [Nanorana parkeri]|uniref:uncharacterized protein LOC108793576 n=1 Tax=Nanorana parkeri TaxID=125878 RepID=UPI00085505FC|nr:PREDICTED: uncharacterized protein LOC108793576 [Nanorana parkeri]
MDKERVLCYEDINLSEEVLKFAGKTELYIGKGKNSTYDRLALQDILKELTTAQEEDTDKAKATQRKIAAVKEIVVYLPSKILYGGKEILEMPGTDDSDPIAMFSIRNALSEVDAVILVTEFGFKICEKEVKDMLSESGFLQKFKKDPSNNKLMLIAYPEKNSKWQFSCDGKNKIEKLEQESKKKKEGELKAISKILDENCVGVERSLGLLELESQRIFGSSPEPRPKTSVITNKTKIHAAYLLLGSRIANNSQKTVET